MAYSRDISKMMAIATGKYFHQIQNMYDIIEQQSFFFAANFQQGVRK